MFKRFYVLAWLVLIGTALASFLTGSLDELGMVTLGVIALGLIYAIGWWTIRGIGETGSGDGQQFSTQRSERRDR